MTRELIANIVRFFVLFLVQGLLLSNVVLWDGKAQIFLYVLFIIMLPLRLSSLVVMGLSFLMGLCVDMFYNSAGLHASAAVVIGFVRPYFIRYFTPRDDYDVNDRPSIGSMGFLWFLKFSSVLILIHAIWIFFLEAFHFTSLISTMSKVFLSAFVTLLIAMSVGFLFTPRRS